MKAAAWADWVRGGTARSYGHSTWHYINYPVTSPGGGVDPAKHQPPEGQENAVWAMNRCLDKIKNGTDEEKAVYMTWLFHLVGDIHQPLHCVALYSTKYPDGDRGGNSIRIRISSSPTNLHSFWDRLLGRGLTVGSIGKDVAEIEAVMKEKAETIKPDLDAHKTPDSWAREGAEIAARRFTWTGSCSSRGMARQMAFCRHRRNMRRQRAGWHACRLEKEGQDWATSSRLCFFDAP